MSEIVGQRMSEYPKLNELTQAEQETYLANAAVTTYGKTSDDGNNTNVNVPLSAIKPDVPVTDVTVGGNSVVSNGVAIIPKYSADYPILNNGYAFSLDYNNTQFKIAGTNYTELTLTNPVPAPNVDHSDAGKVLTVKTINNTDEIVWDSPASPQVNVDGSTIMNGADGLHVNPGYGLTVGSGALCVAIRDKYGLESDGSGIKVVADKGIMITSSGGVGIDFKHAADGQVLTAHETEDTDDDDNPIYDVEWKSIEGVPPTSGASDGDVLTYNTSDGIVWAPAQGGGGGGGLSPISPTTITPTLENNTYKIVIPGNNAYYIATINDTHNVEITPPTIGANEMYNVVLFVVSDDFGDKQMTMAYSDYGISPLDDESKYGWVYGHGFTQFILLGRGFTMKTSAYQGG